MHHECSLLHVKLLNFIKEKNLKQSRKIYERHIQKYNSYIYTYICRKKENLFIERMKIYLLKE